MVNGFLRLRGVAGHQGIENVLVFGAHLLAPASGTEQCGDAHQNLPDVELAVRPGDELIARGVDQLLVEQGVQADELRAASGLSCSGSWACWSRVSCIVCGGHPALLDDQPGGVAFKDRRAAPSIRTFPGP